MKPTTINIKLSSEMNKACIDMGKKLSTPNKRVTKQSILEGFVRDGFKREGYNV